MVIKKEFFVQEDVFGKYIGKGNTPTYHKNKGVVVGAAEFFSLPKVIEIGTFFVR